MGDMPNNPRSIYNKDYLPKSANKPDRHRSIDPFQGKAINPPHKSSFTTTNNTLLQNWGSVNKAGLDETKLKELRGHHFNLGNYDPSDIYTTNKHYHNRK